MKQSACWLSVLLLCLAAAAAAGPVQYEVRDMSGIFGRYVDPKDISNHGVIVGDAVFGADTHAFHWSEARGLVDLGAYPGGRLSSAKAVNDSGRVVGFGDVPAVVDGVDRTVTHALMWDLDGNVTDLGVLPGAVSSAAFDMNDNGEILGLSRFEIPNPSGGLPGFVVHAVIWDQSGSIIRDLGPLFPYYQWLAWKINNQGDILGYNMGEHGYEHWLRRSDGTMTILDKMDGEYIRADCVNHQGLAAGSLSDASHRYLATVWNPDGSVRSRLEPLAGDVFSMAYGISSQGVVAGESSTSDSFRAVLWNPDGSAVALDPLPGFETSRAKMINDLGWVVGECAGPDGWRTVLWTPVPEPASLLTLAIGLGALLARRRVR